MKQGSGFRRSIATGIVFAAVTLMLACATPTPKRAPLPPGDPRPGNWLRDHVERSHSRTSLRGALRVSLDSPDLRFRRPQRLALRRPADLRVEVLGLFGQVAAVLVTDGTTYQSFVAGTGGIEGGVVTEDLLWRLARVDLAPFEAVELLLGAPLPSPGTTIAETFAWGEGVGLDLRDPTGRLRERMAFDAQGRVVAFTRYDRDERIAWHAKFADYRDLRGTPVAFDLRLQFPALDAEATLLFDEAVFGVELSDELFALRAREGSARP